MNLLNHDDFSWLVYADWLEERANSLSEHIRFQVLEDDDEEGYQYLWGSGVGGHYGGSRIGDDGSGVGGYIGCDDGMRVGGISFDGVGGCDNGCFVGGQ